MDVNCSSGFYYDIDIHIYMEPNFRTDIELKVKSECSSFLIDLVYLVWQSHMRALDVGKVICEYIQCFIYIKSMTYVRVLYFFVSNTHSEIHPDFFVGPSRCRFPKFEKGMILKGLRQDSSELACYSHNGGVVHFKPTKVPFCPAVWIIHVQYWMSLPWLVELSEILPFQIWLIKYSPVHLLHYRSISWVNNLWSVLRLKRLQQGLTRILFLDCSDIRKYKLYTRMCTYCPLFPSFPGEQMVGN